MKCQEIERGREGDRERREERDSENKIAREGEAEFKPPLPAK